MPKYNVHVTQESTECGILTVEADSQEEAERIAREMIDCSTIDDIEWNESIPDGPIEIDGVYLTNYDEDDDEDDDEDSDSF